MMRLHLVDSNGQVAVALAKVFDGENVTCGKFEQLDDIGVPWDAIVSAGNSYGIMDGGIDMSTRIYFGKQIEERVQKTIRQQHFGELPVGAAIVVPTENKNHPWLVYTPTMIVPQIITGTQNVYFAMLAALHAAARHNNGFRRIDGSDKIKTLLCSGLGTLTGRIPPQEAANQMFAAYKNFKDRNDAFIR